MRRPLRIASLWRLSCLAVAAHAAILLFVAPAHGATLTWWSSGSTGSSGGAGTWDTSSLRWTANGSTWQAWNNAASPLDVASFGGATAGTVTLSTGITTNGLIFNTAGYTITGNTLTLAGSTPTITANQDAAISSILAGSAGMTKSGAGTLTLTAANTYTGTTTISQGTLQVGNGGTTGSLASSTIVNNANLVYSYSGSGIASFPSGSLTGSGNLSGTAGFITLNGNLTQGGAISLVQNGDAATYNGISLTGANAITGSSITISADIGNQVSNGNSLSLDTSAANGPMSLNFSLGRNGRFYSPVSFTANAGTGMISVVGTGPASSGWRDTPVALTGQLNVTAAVSSGTTVTLNQTTATGTVSGALSGNMSLVKGGVGTLTLTAANSYTGTTSVNSGALVLQNTSQSSGFAVASGVVLELNLASGVWDNATTTFSGAGTLRKTGAGQVKWGAGAATFAFGSGALIDVQSGTFTGGSNANEVWTNNKSDLNVAAGAVFDGVESNVRVNAITGSGTIKSGFGGGGSVSIGVDNGSSTFAGVIADSQGSSGNLVKAGTGTITLSGASTYTGPTTVAAGTLVAGANAPSGANGVFGNATSPIVVGDGSTGVTDSPAVLIGGAFTVGRNISIGFVANTAAYTPVLGGTNASGTATFSGGITLNTTAANYTGLLLIAAPGGTVNFTGSWTTNNKPVTVGSAGNTGTVRLSSAMATTGGVSLNVGTLLLGTASALGSTTPVTMGGGTLDIAALAAGIGTLSGSGTITGTTGGVLTVTQAANATFSGAIAGNAGLVKTGAGTLGLSGANTYSGTTTLSGGVLLLNAAENSGTSGPLGTNTAAGAIVFSSGTLQYSGSNQFDYSPRFSTANNQAYNIDTNGQSVTLGTALTSSGGSLTKSGSGTLTLTQDATFSGTTTVSGGTLALGNGGTAGSVAGAIALSNTAGLVVNRSNNLTLGGAIGGTGSLTQSGAGTLSLTAANTYTGATSVSSGTLVLQNTSQSSGFAVASGAALELNVASGQRDYATTTFSGAGTLRKTGAGTVLWGAGAATFAYGSGALIDVQAGTFTGGSTNNEVWTNNKSDLNVAAGAVFDGVEANVRVNAITGSGTIRSGYGGGGSVSIGVDNGSSTFAGVIANSYSAANLVKAGTGTITLSGTNTYTGTTKINAGILQFGSRNSLYNGGTSSWTAANISTGSGATLAVSVGSSNFTTTDVTTLLTNLGGLGGSVTNNGLQAGSSIGFDTSNAGGAFTVADAIKDSTGTGGGAIGLVKLGSGTLVLSGSNGFTGATRISSGILSIGGTSGLAGTSGVTIAGGAGLTYTGTADTFGKNITVTAGSGTGTIRNSGGLLTLSGTLSKDNSVLRLTGGSFNVTGLITGTTAGTSDLVVDAASVTLSNTNTYNGPTYVYNSGTLSLGINNAIPNTSAVTLGNATSVGTLALGTYTDSIAQLLFTGSGGTLSLSGDKTASAQLVTNGLLALGPTSSLVLTSPGTTLGLYRLISYTSRSGTFASANVTGLPTNYTLLYTGTEIDLQRKADQAATFTLSTGTVTRALVNTTVALSGSITNTSPAGAANLGVSLSSGGVLNVTGLSSGTSSLVPQASTSVAGTIQAGNVAGLQSWSVINTDSGAIQTTSTATGSLTVVNQRVFTTSTSTLALGLIHLSGSVGSPTLVVTSTGLNDVTANATLNSFTGGPSGLALNLTSGSAAFMGTTSPQSATYTLSGTALTPGSISGTFASSVTAEFGSISDVTVAVTGQVFSGTATWTVPGGGAWGTGASSNWTSAGGVQAAPGTFAGFTNTDKAIFAGSQTGTSTIRLDGATPSLAALMFTNTSGSYLIDQGSGGSLALASASGVPTVDVQGLHEIKTAILGSQGFQKTGAGTLVLSGSSGSFAGGTDLAQGALVVNGFLGGAVNVASGATLAGAGAVGGLVSVAGGGILAPGNGGPGTFLAGGGLSLADAAMLNFQLSATTFSPGGVNDLVTVTGDFTLAGVLNVAAFGAVDFSAVPNYTNWRLFNYSGGTFKDNGLSFGSMPNVGGGGRYYAIDTSTSGQVNLVIVPEPRSLALAGIGVGLAGWAAYRRRRRSTPTLRR